MTEKINEVWSKGKLKAAITWHKTKSFIASRKGKSAVLALVGATCFCIAGFTIAVWLGFSITGLAFMSAAYNIDPPGGNNE